jgi:hypothetical protein
MRVEGKAVMDVAAEEFLERAVNYQQLPMVYLGGGPLQITGVTGVVFENTATPAVNYKQLLMVYLAGRLPLT